MVELNKNHRSIIEPLFTDIYDTAILSCFQGYMGRAWTNDDENPVCALIQNEEFCYLAGEETKEETKELIRNVLQLTGLKEVLLMPQKDSLGKIVEENLGKPYEKRERHKMKKRKLPFDTEVLTSVIAYLPEEYQLTDIRGNWYDEALKEDWTEGFVSAFSSKEDFEKKGFGKIIIHKGKIISGASSFTVYDEGIEVMIATSKDYRKQGLAKITAAALILESEKRGLYPNWDARNLTSVHIAKSLGYEYDGPYTAYRIKE